MRVIDLREQFVVYVIYSGDGWRYRGGGGGDSAGYLQR